MMTCEEMIVVQSCLLLPRNVHFSALIWHFSIVAESGFCPFRGCADQFRLCRGGPKDNDENDIATMKENNFRRFCIDVQHTPVWLESSQRLRNVPSHRQTDRHTWMAIAI
jgi:hypothetical protein